MLKYLVGHDIFSSPADALVNPVNCRGVMGKGLALEFKKRFPECFPPYKQACDARHLVVGTLMFVQLKVQPALFEIRRPAIILFPTKDHWLDKSKIEWIEQGLKYLKAQYRQWNLTSIAMPQIGCGLGGLRWHQVMPLIEKYLADEEIDVEIYVRSESENSREAPVEKREAADTKTQSGGTGLPASLSSSESEPVSKEVTRSMTADEKPADG